MSTQLGGSGELHVYAFEDENGGGSMFTTQDYKEAEAFATEHHMLLIDHTFTWEDSEPVQDYRGGHFSEHFAGTDTVLESDDLAPGETCPECDYTAEEDEDA